MSGNKDSRRGGRRIVDKRYKIFTINPGSTSTKIALFEDDTRLFSAGVSHDADELAGFREIKDQFPYRKAAILGALARSGVSLEGTSAFVGRCGGMGPTAGGTFAINDLLLLHATEGRVTKHPANLGAILAHEFAMVYGGAAFIVNPPDTDEFDLIARICGLSDVTRESKGHPLNQKEVAHRYAASIGAKYEDLNLVISHIGGGVSVTAHRKGRMIDSTDNMDGDGPMAPTRAGAIPAVAIVRMCFSGRYTEKDMYDRITKSGGFVDHLGTSDAKEIRKRIRAGDGYAGLVYDAMIYQIGKSIAAYAAVLKGNVDAVLITGAIANDTYLVEQITDMVKFIGPVKAYPGEFEMEALAAGTLRVLTGKEEARTYTGEPVWKGLSGRRNDGKREVETDNPAAHVQTETSYEVKGGSRGTDQR